MASDPTTAPKSSSRCTTTPGSCSSGRLQPSRPRRFAPLILLVLLGLATAGCGGGEDENVENPATDATTEASGGGKTLNGSVGPGFDISLDATDGLKPGSYKLVVKALKALGDPANPAHWETWTSPTITIDRP